MKLVNIIILIMSMVLASFAAWDGETIKQPSTKTIDGRQYYAIGNPEELAWFANRVNSGDTAINAILTDDVDLNMKSWKPIGFSDSVAYDGVFDGENHSVSGIDVSGHMYAGLFGVLDAGCVKNLNLKNSSIQGNYTKTLSYEYSSFIGGIAAYARASSRIENVVNNARILGPLEIKKMDKDDKFILYMGGIVGYSIGLVKNCENKGDVISSLNKERYFDKAYLGGVAGVWLCGNNKFVSNTLKNYGNVFGGGYTGGVIGESGSIIYGDTLSVINYGTITGNRYIGGILGKGVYSGNSSGNERLFINYGNVTVDSAQSSLYVGGLFGIFDSSVFQKIKGVNYGDVSAISDSSVYVGGVAGFVYLMMNNVANHGNVKGSSKNGYSYVGGLAGTFHTKYYNSCMANIYNQGSLKSSHYAAGIIPFVPQPVNSPDSSYIKNFYVASNEIEAPMSAAFVYSNGVGVTLKNGYLDNDLLPSIPLIVEKIGDTLNLRKYSTKQMKADSFAYVLNFNGYERYLHENYWSRDTSYPFFADSSHYAILKINFIREKDTIIEYTNYKKEIKNVVKDVNPNFIGWYRGISNEKADSLIISKHLFELKDSVIYAAYKSSDKDAQKNVPNCLGFIYDKCDYWNLVLKEYFTLYNLPVPTVTAATSSYCSDENKDGILNWADPTSVWYSTYNRQNEEIESYKKNINTIIALDRLNHAKCSIFVNGRFIQIMNAEVGATYVLFDMQGRVWKRGRIESANENITISQLGSFVVTVGTHTQLVHVK